MAGMGRGRSKKEDIYVCIYIYIYIADSLHCTEQTDTTSSLWSNHTKKKWRYEDNVITTGEYQWRDENSKKELNVNFALGKYNNSNKNWLEALSIRIELIKELVNLIVYASQTTEGNESENKWMTHWRNVGHH